MSWRIVLKFKSEISIRKRRFAGFGVTADDAGLRDRSSEKARHRGTEYDTGTRQGAAEGRRRCVWSAQPGCHRPASCIAGSTSCSCSRQQTAVAPAYLPRAAWPVRGTAGTGSQRRACSVPWGAAVLLAVNPAASTFSSVIVGVTVTDGSHVTASGSFELCGTHLSHRELSAVVESHATVPRMTKAGVGLDPCAAAAADDGAHGAG